MGNVCPTPKQQEVKKIKISQNWKDKEVIITKQQKEISPDKIISDLLQYSNQILINIQLKKQTDVDIIVESIRWFKNNHVNLYQNQYNLIKNKKKDFLIYYLKQYYFSINEIIGGIIGQFKQYPIKRIVITQFTCEVCRILILLCLSISSQLDSKDIKSEDDQKAIDNQLEKMKKYKQDLSIEHENFQSLLSSNEKAQSFGLDYELILIEQGIQQIIDQNSDSPNVQLAKQIIPGIATSVLSLSIDPLLIGNIFNGVVQNVKDRRYNQINDIESKFYTLYFMQERNYYLQLLLNNDGNQKNSSIQIDENKYKQRLVELQGIIDKSNHWEVHYSFVQILYDLLTIKHIIKKKELVEYINQQIQLQQAQYLQKSVTMTTDQELQSQLAINSNEFQHIWKLISSSNKLAWIKLIKDNNNNNSNLEEQQGYVSYNLQEKDKNILFNLSPKNRQFLEIIKKYLELSHPMSRDLRYFILKGDSDVYKFKGLVHYLRNGRAQFDENQMQIEENNNNNENQENIKKQNSSPLSSPRSQKSVNSQMRKANDLYTNCMQLIECQGIFRDYINSIFILFQKFMENYYNINMMLSYEQQDDQLEQVYFQVIEQDIADKLKKLNTQINYQNKLFEMIQYLSEKMDIIKFKLNISQIEKEDVTLQQSYLQLNTINIEIWKFIMDLKDMNSIINDELEQKIQYLTVVVECEALTTPCDKCQLLLQKEMAIFREFVNEKNQSKNKVNLKIKQLEEVLIQIENICNQYKMQKQDINNNNNGKIVIFGVLSMLQKRLQSVKDIIQKYTTLALQKEQENQQQQQQQQSQQQQLVKSKVSQIITTNMQYMQDEVINDQNIDKLFQDIQDLQIQINQNAKQEQDNENNDNDNELQQQQQNQLLEQDRYPQIIQFLQKMKSLVLLNKKRIEKNQIFLFITLIKDILEQFKQFAQLCSTYQEDLYEYKLILSNINQQSNKKSKDSKQGKDQEQEEDEEQSPTSTKQEKFWNILDEVKNLYNNNPLFQESPEQQQQQSSTPNQTPQSSYGWGLSRGDYLQEQMNLNLWKIRAKAAQCLLLLDSLEKKEQIASQSGNAPSLISESQQQQQATQIQQQQQSQQIIPGQVIQPQQVLRKFMSMSQLQQAFEEVVQNELLDAKILETDKNVKLVLSDSDFVNQMKSILSSNWEREEKRVKKQIKNSINLLNQLQQEISQEKDDARRAEKIQAFRKKQKEINHQIANIEDIGSMLQIQILFLQDMKTQLNSIEDKVNIIDNKLDNISGKLDSMVDDVKYMRGKSVKELIIQRSAKVARDQQQEAMQSIYIPLEANEMDLKGNKKTVSQQSNEELKFNLMNYPLLKDFAQSQRHQFQLKTLDQKIGVIEEFVLMNTHNAMLLHGAAGSGKSTTARKIEHFIWQFSDLKTQEIKNFQELVYQKQKRLEYRVDLSKIDNQNQQINEQQQQQEKLDKIWIDLETQQLFPIFVRLPSLKNPLHGAIQETLQTSYNFDQKQIQSLKEQVKQGKIKIIFILDGYDELKPEFRDKNLYDTNNLEDWAQEDDSQYIFPKTIVTSRSEALTTKGYFEQFTNKVTDAKKYKEVNYYVEYKLDFSQEKVQEYLSAYAKHSVKLQVIDIYKSQHRSQNSSLNPSEFTEFWSNIDRQIVNNVAVEQQQQQLQQLQSNNNHSNNQTDKLVQPEQIKFIVEKFQESKDLIDMPQELENQFKKQLDELWPSSKYMDVIREIQLLDLIDTPFILEVIVQVLPLMHEQFNKQEIRLKRMYDQLGEFYCEKLRNCLLQQNNNYQSSSKSKKQEENMVREWLQNFYNKCLQGLSIEKGNICLKIQDQNQQEEQIQEQKSNNDNNNNNDQNKQNLEDVRNYLQNFYDTTEVNRLIQTFSHLDKFADLGEAVQILFVNDILLEILQLNQKNFDLIMNFIANFQKILAEHLSEKKNDQNDPDNFFIQDHLYLFDKRFIRKLVNNQNNIHLLLAFLNNPQNQAQLDQFFADFDYNFSLSEIFSEQLFNQLFSFLEKQASQQQQQQDIEVAYFRTITDVEKTNVLNDTQKWTVIKTFINQANNIIIEKALAAIFKSDISKYDFYEAFLKRYNRDQLSKVQRIGYECMRHNMEGDIDEYQSRLACQMNNKQITQILYTGDQLFKQASEWDCFFGSSGSGGQGQKGKSQDIKQIVRQCIPLRASGYYYSFNHKSIQEFLVAKRFYNQIKHLEIDENMINLAMEASIFEQDYLKANPKNKEAQQQQQQQNNNNKEIPVSAIIPEKKREKRLQNTFELYIKNNPQIPNLKCQVFNVRKFMDQLKMIVDLVLEYKNSLKVTPFNTGILNFLDPLIKRDKEFRKRLLFIAKLSRLSSFNKQTESITSIIMELLNFVRMSFSGLDDLTHLKLKSVNMQYAMLYGVNMSNCFFKDVNFTGAIMDECKLNNSVSVGSTFGQYKTLYIKKPADETSKIYVSLDEQYIVISYPMTKEILVFALQQQYKKLQQQQQQRLQQQQQQQDNDNNNNNDSAEFEKKFQLDFDVLGVSFTLDRKFALVYGKSNKFVKIPLASQQDNQGQIVEETATKYTQIQKILNIHDQELLIAASLNDKESQVISYKSKNDFSIINNDKYPITSINFSPSQEFMAGIDQQSNLIVYNIKAGNTKKSLGLGSSVFAFSPDDKYIAVYAELPKWQGEIQGKHQIAIYNIRQNMKIKEIEVVKVIEEINKKMSDIVFSNSGQFIYTRQEDTYAIDKWENYLVDPRKSNFDVGSLSIAISSNDSQLFSLKNGFSGFYVFQMKKIRKDAIQLKGINNILLIVEFFKGDKLLFTVDYQLSSFQIWDLELGSCISEGKIPFPYQVANINCCFSSLHAQIICSYQMDSKESEKCIYLSIFDVDTYRWVNAKNPGKDKIRLHRIDFENPIQDSCKIVCSPSGQKLAFHKSSDKEIIFFQISEDRTTFKELTRISLPGAKMEMSDVIFSNEDDKNNLKAVVTMFYYLLDVAINETYIVDLSENAIINNDKKLSPLICKLNNCQVTQFTLDQQYLICQVDNDVITDAEHFFLFKIPSKEDVLNDKLIQKSYKLLVKDIVKYILSPNGQFVAYLQRLSRSNLILTVATYPQLHILQKISISNSVSKMKFSSNGEYIAIATYDCQLRIWKLKQTEQLQDSDENIDSSNNNNNTKVQQICEGEQYQWIWFNNFSKNAAFKGFKPLEEIEKQLFIKQTEENEEKIKKREKVINYQVGKQTLTFQQISDSEEENNDEDKEQEYTKQ